MPAAKLDAKLRKKVQGPPPLRRVLSGFRLPSGPWRLGLACGHVWTGQPGRVGHAACYACIDGRGWHADFESQAHAGLR